MPNSDMFVLFTCDEGLAGLLTELLHGGAVQRASNLAGVLAATSGRPRAVGVIVDLDCVEAPVEFVRNLRKANPHVPLLALSSVLSNALINPLHEDRVELVVKPDVIANVSSFVQRARSAGFLPQQRLETWLDALAQRCRLSASERALAAGVLADDDLTRIARSLGYGERTLKQEVRSLLRKCQMRTLDGFTKTVLSEALAWDGQSPLTECDEDEREAVTLASVSCAAELPPSLVVAT
jgi:hypothetical protein